MPRSGHHLLERLLRLYFSDPDLISASQRPSDAVRPGFEYCEHYHCCRARPCSNFADKPQGTVCFQKSHDEYLRRGPNYEQALFPSDSVRNLIQVRDPIQSLMSDFELAKANARRDRPNNLVTRDGWAYAKFRMKGLDQLDWKYFAPLQLGYRIQFLRKWILENPYIHSDRVMVLNYDSLLDSPMQKSTKVLEFLAPNLTVSKPCLETALERLPVKQKKNWQVSFSNQVAENLASEAQALWQECVNLIES